MTNDTYYLSSLDSIRFEPVRECRFVEYLTFDTGKVAASADINPAVIGQDFNRESDIALVILTPRHEGVTIDHIVEFPCFVFIAIPRDGLETPPNPLTSEDLQIIGWGELYRTQADAEQHTFD